MTQKKHIYFASDVHLGAPSIKDPLNHEKFFVSWLDSIKYSASEIYLVGDIFDFWFEYKKAIPKGYTRFLGKLSELSDAGITVHFFTGNHDIWIFDYLPKETGIKLYRAPTKKTINGKLFLIGHGDGMSPKERSYNRLKSIFTNKTAQKLFRLLHPDLGIKIAQAWSKKSRQNNENNNQDKINLTTELLIEESKNILKENHYDYFIFGHNHHAEKIKLNNKSELLFLGDWLKLFSYAKWDGEQLILEYYKPKQ
ncbi:UDP-2,3-diacylglucosamine diphosphatase [Marinilabiliaceae bacterium ANBcel2]|nr:UDP-2,3-diacylglucosamine diphosphatase [Marinilabiliaceae bacterium ANBcel2]